jgi:hypothetical protein
MSRVIALTSLLLLALNPVRAAGANRDAHRLHFRVMAGSVIVIPVTANGSGPYDFVFDTGSESTLIDADLARQLGIAPVDRVRLESSNGPAVLTRTFAVIALGPARVLNSEVLVGPMNALHSLDRKIRGMVGQSFLRHFDYILDNSHAAIELAVDAEQPMAFAGRRLDLSRMHSLPIVAANLKDSSQLNLVLDSGASNVTLFGGNRRNPSGLRMEVSSAELRSSVSTSRVATARINLEVAGYGFRDIRAALEDVYSPGEVDGMLPTSLFSRIYFNNSKGYVVLEAAH